MLPNRERSQNGLEVEEVFAHILKLAKYLTSTIQALLKKGVPKSEFYVVIDRLAFSRGGSRPYCRLFGAGVCRFVKFSKATLSPQAEVLTVDGKRLLAERRKFLLRLRISAFQLITSALFSVSILRWAPVPIAMASAIFWIWIRSKVVPNPELTLAQGAIAPFAMPSAAQDRNACCAPFAKKCGSTWMSRGEDLPEQAKAADLEGHR